MFGYACDETPELMPLSHSLATSLGKRLTDVRKTGVLPYIRPDGKTQVGTRCPAICTQTFSGGRRYTMHVSDESSISPHGYCVTFCLQVTVEYDNTTGVPVPVRVHTIVISTQHAPDVDNEQLRRDIMEHVIKPVVPERYLDANTIYHLNPSGRFVIGGPHGDAGLTGRKIIIDTYGGWGAHGGGAFSGKDSTKVDRSAAYAARWAAKSLVANGFCKRCLVQVSRSSVIIGSHHKLNTQHAMIRA